ncbi:hypothetical protein EDC25_101276 [Pseudofulvimonas gallinarii]|uniref:Uncharacterized protein n=1 Tax=Pseudofulvimonas gallinarii TaxID=634155 RepID=A0A4V2UWY3_9GAMM|nr:hypothetical protein EDC25_101276 [Pseudofulvimonas gallinarii]
MGPQGPVFVSGRAGRARSHAGFDTKAGCRSGRRSRPQGAVHGWTAFIPPSPPQTGMGPQGPVFVSGRAGRARRHAGFDTKAGCRSGRRSRPQGAVHGWTAFIPPSPPQTGMGPQGPVFVSGRAGRREATWGSTRRPDAAVDGAAARRARSTDGPRSSHPLRHRREWARKGPFSFLVERGGGKPRGARHEGRLPQWTAQPPAGRGPRMDRVHPTLSATDGNGPARARFRFWSSGAAGSHAGLDRRPAAVVDGAVARRARSRRHRVQLSAARHDSMGGPLRPVHLAAA